MSKKKFNVIFRQDLNNVGDLASQPLQYFLQPDEYNVADITDVYKSNLNWNLPTIVGGGGLIANQFFGEVLRDFTDCNDKSQLLNLANEYWQTTTTANTTVRDEFMRDLQKLIETYVDKLQNVKSPRIIWGAGHNSDYQKKIRNYLDYPKWLQLYDLIGIRDYNQPYEWVPCASCMHPAFSRRYEIKHDVIWFEHKKQLLKNTDFGAEPIPRFLNSGNNVEHIIEILGSANVILTNSYHGAYWGILLGKKVIVMEPWSSKFNAFRWTPGFVSKGSDWKLHIDDVNRYPEALEISRDVTKKYWSKVKEYMK